MRTPKKPPPDTVGNVRGRMSALRTSATQNARMSAKEGQDFVKSLGKELKQIAPQMKKLKARLEKARKNAPASPAKPPSKPRKKARRAPETTQKPAKKQGSARVPADYDDLLATLGDL